MAYCVFEASMCANVNSSFWVYLMNYASCLLLVSHRLAPKWVLVRFVVNITFHVAVSAANNVGWLVRTVCHFIGFDEAVITVSICGQPYFYWFRVLNSLYIQDFSEGGDPKHRDVISCRQHNLSFKVSSFRLLAKSTEFSRVASFFSLIICICEYFALCISRPLLRYCRVTVVGIFSTHYFHLDHLLLA